MIPYVITARAARIAHFYWGKSWMEMHVSEVDEAIEWFNQLTPYERFEVDVLTERLLIGPR